MRPSRRIIFLLAFVCLSSPSLVRAQTPPTSPGPMSIETQTNMRSPGSLLTAAPMPMETLMVMQMPADSGESIRQQQTSPNLYPPPKEWPKPVEHDIRHLFLLADVLEFSPKGKSSDFHWDIEGWYGGDFNRLWFKSEGEQTATQPERDIDFQLLYGRFVARYYDLQLGGRVDTKTFRGRSVTRGHAVIGLEGFVPYSYELESALFVSQKGDVSGRFSLTKDFLMTQRWILQPRFETNVAVQRVERFGVGKGVNDIELGLRLRYELKREFAPYVGFSWTRMLGDTADLARREGEKINNIGVVFGVRLWF